MYRNKPTFVCYWRKLYLKVHWPRLLSDVGLLNVLEQTHICVVMEEIIFKLSLASTPKRCETTKFIGINPHLCVNGVNYI